MRTGGLIFLPGDILEYDLVEIVKTRRVGNLMAGPQCVFIHHGWIIYTVTDILRHISAYNAHKEWRNDVIQDKVFRPSTVLDYS